MHVFLKHNIIMHKYCHERLLFSTTFSMHKYILTLISKHECKAFIMMKRESVSNICLDQAILFLLQIKTHSDTAVRRGIPGKPGFILHKNFQNTKLSFPTTPLGKLGFQVWLRSACAHCATQKKLQVPSCVLRTRSAQPGNTLGLRNFRTMKCPTEQIMIVNRGITIMLFTYCIWKIE